MALEADRGDAVELEALRALMASLEPVLRGLARRLTGNDSDTEDLLQDTFERAVRCREQLRDLRAARSWLISILRNAFLDRCRRQRAESQGRDYDLPEELAATADPPDEPVWAELDLADLKRALLDLEPEFRIPYEMKELQGLSYKEIAKEIGVPVSTVATRIHRARLKLRELLSQVKRGPRHE
jgi:RNA polymerase sigma-70 factor (ECF subfamily)